MAEYYKVVSNLKQEHTFQFSLAPVRDDKGNLLKVDGRVKAKNTKVGILVIPGQYRKNDNPKVSFISAHEYDCLTREEHEGAPSPFTILMENGENGGIGLMVKEVTFDQMPPEFQQKYDLVRYDKLQKAKKKALLEEADRKVKE